MKKFLIVLLLAILAFSFAKQEESQCNVVLGRIRFVLLRLPENIKERILGEVLNIMAQVFARIDYKITEGFVKGLGDKDISTEKLCEVWEEIFVPEMQRQEQCIQKCIEKIDISPEKLLAIVLKCKTDFECYRDELMKIADELLPCVMACVASDNDKKHFAIKEFPQTYQYEKEVEEYWTEERMNNAIPMFMEFGSDEMSPIMNQPQDTKFVEDYTKTPYKQTGKVFFQMGGRNYVCSGSSNGNNAVLTAGHCVSDGRGRFHTKWVFRPQFKEGATPKGTFVANKLITFERWHKRSDLGRDFAWAVVNKNSGKSVEETVGALGFSTCKKGDSATAVGYPVPQFGGQKMVRTKNSITLTNRRFRPASIGIVSPMKGGCSGGPWTKGFDGNNACGVNSYGYRGRNDLYSPYVDSDVLEMRKQAISSE